MHAIREGRTPLEQRYAALSVFARNLIEKRGHVGEEAITAFRSAGFKREQALEVLAVSAASTITNYAGSIAEPPVEPMFQEQARLILSPPRTSDSRHFPTEADRHASREPAS